MDALIYSNIHSIEGVAIPSSVFIDLPWYSRRLVITNDGTSDLTVHLKRNNVATMTLKASETMTVDRFRTKVLKFIGNSVNYRCWVFG